jgi:adenylate kinase
MNILTLGPQGSGKGTQAQLLTEKLGYYYVESGRILREAAKTNPVVDETINQKGRLLPDEETFSLIKGVVESHAPDLDKLIFDGFPRSIRQYELLKDWFRTKGTKLDLAILLEISEDETIRRLSARRTCDKCGKVYNLITNPPPKSGCPCGGALIQRVDDTPSAIKTRLASYRKTTTPMVEQLDREGILVRLNGERSIQTIFQDILKAAQK